MSLKDNSERKKEEAVSAVAIINMLSSVFYGGESTQDKKPLALNTTKRRTTGRFAFKTRYPRFR